MQKIPMQHVIKKYNVGLNNVKYLYTVSLL